MTVIFTMDDMQAIVKPHNDKLIAEGRVAELLAALKALIEHIDFEGEGAGVYLNQGTPFELPVLERARAAIAKAEGRTP